MAGLTAINLVAYLALRVIDQYFALTAFDEYHEERYQCYQDHDEDRAQATDRTIRHQAEQTTQCGRQTRGNPGEDDDRDAITQATLGNLLTQPHQKHCSGQQSDDRYEAECKTRLQYQTSLRLQCDCNTQRLKQCQGNREIPGVLGDLATACFAFFFQRFHLR